jgi:chromosome segregation ATPase
MNLEQTLVALKEAFTGKSAEAEATAKSLADAQASVTNLEEANKVALGLVDSLTSDKSALEAKVASLEAELVKAASVAKAALDAQKSAEVKIETAGKKAAAIAASVGVDAVEVSPVDTSAKTKSNEEIAAEWAILRQNDPKAASEFYTKNRSAIIAAAGLR